MYGFINRAKGIVLVRVCGDMPERFLNFCTGQGIELIGVKRIDDLTLEFAVASREKKALKSAALRLSCEIDFVSAVGSGRWLRMLRLRYIPALMVLALVAVLFVSKFYVWEISVVGNSTVPTGEILDVLTECGVESGAFWPDFSADNIRSEVLYRLPELSWITVNMRGSLAEVIVVERKETPEMVLEGENTDIVAARAGFVTKVDALAGQSCVAVGEAVEEGEILISGAVESSFAPPRFLRSLGSVTGEVNSSLTAMIPQNELQKEHEGRTKRKFALIIGDNRINFYSDSSISDGFCDKIISVWKAEADGLFSLPISLVCIEERSYVGESVPVDGAIAAAELETALRSQFALRNAEAEILNEKLSFGESGCLYTATLRTRCLCEIGESVPISDVRRNEVLTNYIEKADE